MAEEEKNNIAREWGKLIHKSFKYKLWVWWDIETLEWVIGKGGCCGHSPQHTASKGNVSVMDFDMGITVWSDMDYHSDIHRNLMSESKLWHFFFMLSRLHYCTTLALLRLNILYNLTISKGC